MSKTVKFSCLFYILFFLSIIFLQREIEIKYFSSELGKVAIFLAVIFYVILILSNILFNIKLFSLSQNILILLLNLISKTILLIISFYIIGYNTPFIIRFPHIIASYILPDLYFYLYYKSISKTNK